MSANLCVLKHLAPTAQISAYKADMAADVKELVDGGMSNDAAWLQVAESRLADMEGERARIEQVVADAYAETPAGKKAGFGKQQPEVAPAPAAVDAASAPAEAKPAPPPPAPATTLLEATKAAMRSIYDGTASVDDYRAAYRAVVDGQAQLQAELGKLTKDELIQTFGIMRDGKKPELVEIALRSLREGFALGKSFGPNSWVMSPGGYERHQKAVAAALDELVQGQTAEDLAAYAAEVAQKSEEQASRVKKARASVEDPKTLEDFKLFMRFQLGDGKTNDQARMMLTPEQRATFDELAATESRGFRKSSQDAERTQVRVAGQTVDGDIIATKHTRDGHDLYVVRLAERVSTEDYRTLLAGAKRIGGNYSSYRGNGAVPGFQFRTREQAEAFRTLAGGDSTAAQAAAQERRDAFADDRSQTAVERLTEMAERLDERADENMGRERKANTERRARFAASAEAAARADKAMASTMRNIASAIQAGTAKFLDRVRQKVQIETLQAFVRSAQDTQLRAKYESYVDQERHRGAPPDGETADFAEWPRYTAYRSDLASLGRQLLQVEGTKLLGQRLMKVADDITDAFKEFAKQPGNYYKLSTFTTQGGERPSFPTADSAQRAIDRSGYRGKAITFQIKRGEYTILMSPSEAMARGIWKGDGDKRITLEPSFGAELVEKMGRANRRGAKVAVPWQFETTHDRRKLLARMGIETAPEFRAALREFISLREQPAEADKVKQLERALIGRRNDGLDFFPTPASVADEMVAAAGIEPGMRVLEPEAGMGHIAERIREADVEPEVIELEGDKRQLLEAKGFNVIGSDFLQQQEGGYDRILMNPPFSDGRDIQHVRHAYGLLKPGGRLVAIMGESAFTNQNKRATEFREWLETVGGTEEKLAENTFMDPSLPVNTGANARMVVIEKPEAGDVAYSVSDNAGGERVADLRAKLETEFGADTVKALEDAGLLRLADMPREGMPRAAAGATMRDGSIDLLAGNIKPGSTAVAYHEALHATLRDSIGLEAFEGLMARIGDMAGDRFFAEARGRLHDAIPDSVRNEELAAYAVEQYQRDRETMPATLRRWVEDLIAALRAGLARALQAAGVGLRVRTRLLANPAVLHRLARDGLRRQAAQLQREAGAAAAYSQANTSPFFSELARQVEQVKMNAGTADAWRMFLRGLSSKGVKPDEIEWSGLPEWLDMQQELGGKSFEADLVADGRMLSPADKRRIAENPGKVSTKITKAQVLDFLKANGVQVSETRLGGIDEEFEAEPDLRVTDRSTTEGTWDEDEQMMVDGGLEEITVEESESGDTFLITVDSEAGNVSVQNMSSRGAFLEVDAPMNRQTEEDGMRAIRAYYEAQRPAIPEGKTFDGNTKYGEYTLPGGTNYREVLLTLPDPGKQSWMNDPDVVASKAALDAKYPPDKQDELRFETSRYAQEFRRDFADHVSVITAAEKRADARSGRFESSHWDQPNVLAHIRLNDRTDADGKRVLFVEELQSDWAQEGKKRGFNRKATPQEVAREVYGQEFAQMDEQMREGVMMEVEARNEGTGGASGVRSGLVPTAPFVTNTDKWLALALKRVVKMAVDEGYDKVAFVNGDQSAQRYKLRQEVESIAWKPEGVMGDRTLDIALKNGQRVMFAVDEDGKVKAGSITGAGGVIDGKDLEAVVGKDVAKRILEERRGNLEGEGLNIGGAGMKAFYDKIVPAALKDVLKKVGGGKLGTVAIGTAPRYRAQPDTQNPGEWMIVVDGLPQWRGYASEADARADLKVYEESGYGNKPSEIGTQPGFDITDAMRAKAADGLPLFAKAPPVETAAFRAWFGDSKIVDAEGRPLRVFHGTANDFSTFDSVERFASKKLYVDGRLMPKADSWDMGDDRKGMPGSIHYGAWTDALTIGVDEAIAFRERENARFDANPDGNRHLADLRRLKGKTLEWRDEAHATGDGYYFSPSPNYAVAFSGREIPRDGGNLMPVYLSIKNPIYLDAGAIEVAGVASNVEKYKRQGYDGAIFVENNMFGSGRLPLEQDRGSYSAQIVAFDPTQIKSATGNRGTFDPSNPDIRYSEALFSIAPGGGSSPATAQSLASTPPGGVFNMGSLGATGKDRIRNIADKARKFWLGALSRDQLADIYGEELPTAKAYDRIVRAMENERQKMAQEADDLHNDWSKLSGEVNDALSGLMADATFHGLHPDRPLRQGPRPADNILAREWDNKRDTHARLAAEFQALPDEAKDIYRRVSKHYDDTLKALYDALRGRIIRSIGEGRERQAVLTALRTHFDRYKQEGPYFPETRFGEFLVIGERASDGARVVAAYESTFERDAAARALRADGFTVKTKVSKKYTRASDGNAGKYIGDVIKAISDADFDFGDSTKEQLLDDINQLSIRALPDMSYRKHFQHRKNVPGFSRDMRRAFASSMFHAASHIARINHADQMQGVLDDAYKQIDLMPDGDSTLHGQVLNELSARNEASLNPNTHPLAAALNQLGFIMYLGLSPAAGLINMMQTPMVTLPWLGARYTFDGAASALGKALKDISAAPWEWRSGWDAAQSSNLSAEEQAMMQKLQDDGVIDLTQAHDLAAATSMDSGSVARSRAAHTMQRAMRIIGWTFHIPEVINRQTTALAAYRLEMERSGDKAAATELARDAIDRTHFNYASCVDVETECLTVDGWKRYTELKPGDIAIAVDDNGRAVESAVQAVNVHTGGHEVTEFRARTRRFSMVVTDEHDCIVQQHDSGTGKWSRLKKVKPARILNSYHLLRAPLAPLVRPASVGCDFAALLGWVAAEGSYARFRNCKDKRDVRVHQSVSHNPKYVAEIDALLTRLGDCKKYIHRNGEMATWCLRKELAGRVLDAMPDKLLSFDMLKTMNAEEMLALIDAFSKGDGTRSGKAAWSIVQKDGANTHNLHVLQAMAAACGLTSMLAPKPGYGKAVDCNALRIGGGAKRTQRTHARTLVRTRKTVETVWCPTTEHGTWIARRGGTILVTGNSNRPRYMSGNLARVVFQFKQYSQNITYLLARSLHQSLAGESPEVRRIARRQFAAVIGATFTMAGALGLPGISALGGIMGMIATQLGDDDDTPWDWEVEFRNLAADTVGKELGEVLSRGLPRALMPWDISARLGMADLWFRSNAREGQNPREAFAADAVSLLGPTASTVLGAYTAADQMGRGNYTKAIESIIPKAARDIVRAVREESGGVTTYAGEPIRDVSPVETAGRLLGFASARTAELMEGRAAVLNAKTALEEKRSVLVSQLVRAQLDGDTDTVVEMTAEIARFNQRNPMFKLTRESLKRSLENVRRNRAKADDGIVLPPEKASLRERARFARIE